MQRRRFMKLIGASATLLGCSDDGGSAETDGTDTSGTGGTGGCTDDFIAGQSVVVRKGASQMSEGEIERFKQAWALLVANGELDQLAIGHADIDGQRHHGTQIRGDYTGFQNPDNYAQRFLCWHRAYCLDLEQAMRRALVEDYRARGLDCSLADTVFVPYFDGAAYPQWLRDWMPTGTPTGIVVQHIDPTIDPDNGHESNGLELGEYYEAVMRAYEGQSNTCGTAPPAAKLISEAIAHDDFTSMSVALESSPGLLGAPPDPELANLVRAAAEDIVDKDGQHAMVYSSFQVIAAVIETGMWVSQNPQENLVVMLGLTALDRGRLYDEYGIQNWTDEQFETVLAATNAHLQRSPHAVLHFYSAGESQAPGVRGLYGSSAYFQDAGADPHFYMLHAELDRYFATWIATHDDMPVLEGEDRLFQTWPGAREWTVEELMNPDALPSAYDELWSA